MYDVPQRDLYAIAQVGLYLGMDSSDHQKQSEKFLVQVTFPSRWQRA
jgi:hypothetical protein